MNGVVETAHGQVQPALQRLHAVAHDKIFRLCWRWRLYLCRL